MPLPIIVGTLGAIATEVIAEIAEQGMIKMYDEYIKPNFDFFSEDDQGLNDLLGDDLETPSVPGTLSQETLLEVKDLLISLHRYYGIKMPASVTVEENV